MHHDALETYLTKSVDTVKYCNESGLDTCGSLEKDNCQPENDYNSI